MLCVPSVYSYSAGAREESCYNMQAAHVDTISGNNRSSNDCFQFGACQFSLEVVALVNSDDRTVIDDGTITTYECGKDYEGKLQAKGIEGIQRQALMKRGGSPDGTKGA